MFSGLTRRQATDAVARMCYDFSQPNMLKTLSSVKQGTELDVISRWQAMLALILPSQFKIVQDIRDEDTGESLFSADQAGLGQFNLSLTQLAKVDPQLQTVVQQKWGLLLKLSFGITDEEYRTRPRLNRQLAREMAIAASHAMQSSAFLQQIDEALEGVEADDVMERRKKLLLTLLPVHQEVLGRFGFKGDKGYVLAQKELMDFVDDHIVVNSINQATATLYQRAGLV